MANDASSFSKGTVTSMGVVAGDNPLHHALLLLMAQLVVIVLFSRIVSFLFRPLRQPRVVAEIIGGILLGPTAVGRIPGFSDAIFPSSSLHILETVADVGLMFFLFLVGLELDLRVLKKSGTSAMCVAAAGIILPFVLGVGVSTVVFKAMDLDGQTKFGAFVLFMGVSLSITAFPVLARILAERKILNTQIGQVAISAAALNDVVAWALLALAVAVTNSDSSPLVVVWVLLFGILYLLVMFGLVRPLVYSLANYKHPIPRVVIAATFLLVIISSFATDAMGVHVIFGAFIMGLVIPKEGPFAGLLIEKVEDFVSILLLPLYFTTSGLKTELDSIDNAKSIGILVLVTATAILGKVGGTVFVTRLQGMDMRSCLSLGVLMSTKGLVELIVLNIGLSKGVINRELFAIMVVMALITTAAATPMLMWLYKPARDATGYRRRHLEAIGKNAKAIVNDKLRLLVCVHGMENVPGMMNLIELSKGKRSKFLQVDALHLMQFSERSSAIRMAALVNADDSPSDEEYDEEGRIALAMAGDAVNVAFSTFSRVKSVKTRVSLTVSRLDSMHEDICSAAAATRANLVVLPFHRYSGPDGTLESRCHGFLQLNFRVMKNSPCSVAILADRGFGLSAPPGQMQHVVVLFFGGPDDREALLFAQRMNVQGGVKLTVVHCVLELKQQPRAPSLGRLGSGDLTQYLPGFSPIFSGLSVKRCKKALLQGLNKVYNWLSAPWIESSAKVEVGPSRTSSEGFRGGMVELGPDVDTDLAAATEEVLSVDDIEMQYEKKQDMKVLGPVLAAAKLSWRLGSVNEDDIPDASVTSKVPKVKVVDLINPIQALQGLFAETTDCALVIAGLHLDRESAIQRTGDLDFVLDSAEHNQGLGPVGNILMSKELKLKSSVLIIRQHRPATDESLGGMSDLKAVSEPTDRSLQRGDGEVEPPHCTP